MSKSLTGTMRLEASVRVSLLRTPAVEPLGQVQIVAVMLACIGVLIGGAWPSYAQGQKPSRSRPQLVLQNGHSSAVRYMAFSPDGRRFATSDHSETILWDLRTGEHLFTFPVSGGYSTDVNFSPDGSVLAILLGDGKVALYDVRTGRLLHLMDNGQTPASLVFSPDGRTLALGSGPAVTLWDYRAGKVLRSFRTHPSSSMSATQVIAFSPDSTQIACASGEGFGDNRVEVWEINRPEKSQAVSPFLQAILRATGDVYSLAFSPDGKTLAIGNGDWLGNPSPVITLWDLQKKTPFRTLTGHRFDILSIAFSPTGATLGTSDAQGIFKSWDVASGAERQSVGQQDFHIPTRVSPDGRLGAEPDRDGAVRIYDLEKGKTVRILPGGGGRGFQTIAFSADGREILTGCRVTSARDERSQDTKGQSELIRWDAHAGNRRETLRATGDANLAATGPHGMVVTAGIREGTVTVWGQVGTSAIPRVFDNPDRRVYALAVSADGERIAVGGIHAQPIREGMSSYGQEVHVSYLEVLDARTGRRLHSLTGGHTDAVTAVAFLPGGHLLASVGDDGAVCRWDVQTGQRKSRVPWHATGLDRAYGHGMCALSRDGNWAIIRAAYDPIRLFDTRTGRPVCSFPISDREMTSGVAISPDGTSFAAVGTETGADGNLRVWSRRHHTQWIHTFAGGSPQQILFSPAGDRLLCLGAHGDLQVWRTRDGHLLTTLVPLGKRDWIAYTPEGRYEGSEGVDAWIRWRVGEALFPASRYRSLLYRPDRVQTALSGRAQMALYTQLRGQEARERAAEELRQHHVAAVAKPSPPVVGNPKVLTPEAATAALRRALSNGDISHPETIARAIRTQVAAGADVNTHPEWGTTPLIFLAEVGDVEGVRSLLQWKPDLDWEDVYGCTALLYAAEAGHTEVVNLLLDAGADLRDQAGKSLLPLRGNPAALGQTLLAVLTYRPAKRESAKDQVFSWKAGIVLLSLGADLNVHDAAGNTPLLALKGCDSPLFHLLAEHGADVNAANAEGDTPLIMACQGSDTAAVRLLLEHGADMTRQAKSGWTALTLAADRGPDEIVRILLERGADPNAVPTSESGEGGRTALMWALSEGHLSVARLLLEHGAVVNAADMDDGWTPLTCAVNGLDITAVKLLLAHGADARVRCHDGRGLLAILKASDPQDRFGIASLLKQAGAEK